MNCRFCHAPLEHLFLSLGAAPPSNAYLPADALGRPESCYPLDVHVCGECFLVQLDQYESPEEIFTDYAYFSSYSESWLEHCQRYAGEIIRRLKLGPGSLVIEAASNDGYLLQYFAAQGIPVLGIEPARNVAEVARRKGIPTETLFLGKETGRRLAGQGRTADLLIGNNVLAHVPDLNDFVEGLRALLKPGGVLTMEFPHLMHLVDQVQFDTIYHEHFSYFSFLTARRVFAAHQLTVFDVEEVPTHGGSLRIYAARAESAPVVSARVQDLENRELAAGYGDLTLYLGFHRRAEALKREILEFFIEAGRSGKTVAGYGAPAKGNTLLNYCGIKRDFLPYTVDRNPYKQGKFLPGSRIPVMPPDQIHRTRPDYLVILPWNLKTEVMEQMAGIREWGGKFVTFMPRVEIL